MHVFRLLSNGSVMHNHFPYYSAYRDFVLKFSVVEFEDNVNL